MRAKKVFPRQPRQRQSGLTLIELMVGLVIGLVLAIVASSVYLYSKQAYNVVSETSQAEENGRFALNLLARNIQNAGFVMNDPGSPLTQGPSDIKVMGCEFGMLSPQTATALSDLACNAATPAGQMPSESISVFYETDAYTSAGARYEGFDCVGNAAVKIDKVASGSSIDRYQVKSHFFVSQSSVQTPNGTTNMGQLSCVADSTGGVAAGNFDAQPLIPGIEQLRIRYLMPSATDQTAAQESLTATALTVGGNWPQVVAVELCVLAKTIQAGGNDSGKVSVDCYGNPIAQIAGESYRTFRTVVNIRNRTTA